MTDIQDKSSIIDKVVFVRLAFGVLGNTRQVTKEILHTDADKKLLKVQKSLLDSPELEAIRKADGRIRAFLKDYCLPYDSGVLMLPSDLIEIVAPEIKTYAEITRPALVDTFIAAYPDLCLKASAELGSLHNPTDYPSIETVKDKFYFDYQYFTFAPPDALKYKGLAAEAEKQFQAKLEEASQSITALMRQTLLELVDHLKVALEPSADGKPKRLFSSTVDNIQEFLNTFKARNITNDADLAKVVSDLEEVIHPGFSVDTLKADASFKEDFHTKIAGITAQLGELVEVVPTRKFKNL